MKKLCFILLYFYTATAFSQQFVVANMKENIVYCGVDNPLSALVEGYPCGSVMLTADNGTITKAGCGYFNYRPTEGGNIKIKVWVKNGKRLKRIGEMPYRAKLLPLPVAFVGVKSGGYISAVELIKMGGVRAMLLNSGFEASFQIVIYTVTATRNKQIIFKLDNTGAQYNDSTLNHLKTLEGNDQLLISNIICKYPDEIERRLQPLEFTITK